MGKQQNSISSSGCSQPWKTCSVFCILFSVFFICFKLKLDQGTLGLLCILYLIFCFYISIKLKLKLEHLV